MKKEKSVEELQKEIARLKKELKSKKKYGLVWEDKPEDVVEMCKEKLPILKEIKDKEILTDETKPMNILIEGDNYHALSALNYTHAGKIDVIYIDPPYNTGKAEEWKFNDQWVDKDDSFRHSKWISLITTRLWLAKKLLRKSGLIFISIDDNELANLIELCNEIFYEKNFVACLPTIMNLKGNQDQFGFAGTHEYTLVYSIYKDYCKFNYFEIEDEEIEKWDEDEVGFYKKGANLKSTGGNAPREKRPYLFYPILVKKSNLKVTTISKPEFEQIYNKATNKFNDKYINKIKDYYEKKGYYFVLPKTDNQFMSWRWERTKVLNEDYNIIISEDDGLLSIYKKQRPSVGDIPSKKPKSLFYKPEYSSGNGTNQLKNIFHKKVFENPKPIELIKDILKIGGEKTCTVLDFFAGSGTTGHAVLDLNKEEYNMKFILITNNENNICSEICYPRLAKAIKGYKNMKKINIDGLFGNLKYFKTDFVDAKPTDRNKKKLTEEATEMLCLKEDTFNEVKTKNKSFRLFNNGRKYTGIIYDVTAIDDFKVFANKLDGKYSVYVFSLSDDTYDEEFSDMKNKYKLSPIPEAILRVYRRIFK